MCTFSLPAEQAEELDWLGASGAEPVGYASVELGRFPRRKHKIVFTEDEPEPPIENVEPFVAFVGLWIGFASAAAGRDHQLVRLDAASSAGQRQHGHAVPGDRPKVDARVSTGRGADELVKRDAVGSCQREQQFESRATRPGL